MINKLGIEIKGAAIIGLCIIVLLIAGTMNSIGQQSGAQAYCVQTGNLYTQQPSLNNGQPICKIGASWCDANAFYTGQCAASSNPFGLPNPYATYNGIRQGTSVYTPYGNVPLDAAYQSGTIPLQGPYYGGWNDPNYGGWGDQATAEQAAWTYGAISFLNAP